MVQVQKCGLDRFEIIGAMGAEQLTNHGSNPFIRFSKRVRSINECLIIAMKFGVLVTVRVGIALHGTDPANKVPSVPVHTLLTIL